MFKIEIVAKSNSNGLKDNVNLLNNGKNYTLYFRFTILGMKSDWMSVPFVDKFPK